MMRYYKWLFPDLVRFPNGPASRSALRKASSSLYAVGVLIGCSLLVVLACSWRIIQSQTGIPQPVLMGLGVAVPGLAGCWAIWYGRRQVTLSLRKQLNDQGIPVCMRCGYDLRALQHARCPECGACVPP